MQKKIFLQKGLRKSNSGSHFKWVMWAAVALIILVLVIPLMTRKKTDKEASKKPSSEKGMLYKEIPKVPGRGVENVPQAEGVPGFIPREPAPETPFPSGPKGAPESQLSGKPVTPAEKVPEGETAAQPKGLSDRFPVSEPAPGALPKEEKPPARGNEGVLSEKPTSPPKTAELTPPAPTEAKKKGAQEGAATAKVRKPGLPEESQGLGKPLLSGGPEGQKQPAAGGKGLFSVQVGSFREKKNADDMQRSLQKRGYDAVVKTHTDPKFGELYVVQLKPVEDVGRANTLVEQIKHEEKVKPFVIRVPDGQ